MISVVITLEDSSTITLTAEHIQLHKDVGIAIVNGVPQENNQSRFYVQGWTGSTTYADFHTDSTTDLSK